MSHPQGCSLPEQRYHLCRLALRTPAIRDPVHDDSTGGPLKPPRLQTKVQSRIKAVPNRCGYSTATEEVQCFPLEVSVFHTGSRLGSDPHRVCDFDQWHVLKCTSLSTADAARDMPVCWVDCGGGFTRTANDVIENSLTSDFWAYRVPELLVTSGPALSPVYQCYLAGLNILDADVFMLRMSVRDWMDPSLPAVKGVDGHHLFPRKYQEKVLGITDLKRVNQAANFAPTDWDTNILIDDLPPAEYWPGLVADRGGDSEWLGKQRYWHALPDSWEKLDYDVFLSQRRHLIAKVIRDAFVRLSDGKGVDLEVRESAEQEQPETATLAELIERSLLRAGDNLDPVDPSWEVDATITADGNIIIDGTQQFDSLDESAHFLGVTNMPGIEFWALQIDEELVPLTELLQEPAVAGRG